MFACNKSIVRSLTKGRIQGCPLVHLTAPVRSGLMTLLCRHLFISYTPFSLQISGPAPAYLYAQFKIIDFKNSVCIDIITYKLM